MYEKKINISVVIPVYNDQEVLDELFKRLILVLENITDKYEVIFVDDGSNDGSWSKIAKLKSINNNVTGINLIRNFGQQNAIAAGFDFVSGDIVILMDSDLQDKPEDIPKLINALEENNSSMAIAKWVSRKDSMFKKLSSKLFYKTSYKLTKIRHQPNLGAFRAIRKEVINELKKYNEKTSTTLSLLYWIGVDYVTVELHRDERFAGKSGYNLHKMLSLTMDRIFSFSMLPIRIAIYVGLTISMISFILGIILIIRYYFSNVALGWTSTFVLILLMFGLNFFFLGIIGEYLGRIFRESKQRPKYIIKKLLK